MLSEVPKTRQIQGEPFRRWFSDRDFDLIVWYGPDEMIVGFQLCYRRGVQEKALTWMEEGGYFHNTVDDGELGAGGPKMTPILVPDGPFNPEAVSHALHREAAAVDPDVVEFVLDKLMAYPASAA